jgi:hypothetical protein
VPLIADGVLGSTTSRVDSPMEISSAPLSSFMWKLNNLKAISKPPVLAKTVPITLEMGSTVVVAEESTANTGVGSTMLGDAVLTMVHTVMSTMVGDVVSTSMADEMMSMSLADEVTSMSMAVGDVESTIVFGDEPSTLVDVNRSAMVGEGAGKSIDPDPVVPMVGAN